MQKAALVWFLAVVGALIGAALASPPADAACSSIPYVFTNNVSVVDATTTNANNNFFLNCIDNVDNTQIGAAGIFASQIKPLTVGEAIFGGSVAYQFSNSLTVLGELSVKANSASDPLVVYDSSNNAVFDVASTGIYADQSVHVAFGKSIGYTGGTANVCARFDLNANLQPATTDCPSLAANTFTGTQTVPALIDSGLSASAGVVCTDSAKTLTTSGCSVPSSTVSASSWYQASAGNHTPVILNATWLQFSTGAGCGTAPSDCTGTVQFNFQDAYSSSSSYSCVATSNTAGFTPNIATTQTGDVTFSGWWGGPGSLGVGPTIHIICMGY